MFEKIYLHVGLPKTGTSYLQSCFDALSRRHAFEHTSYPVLNSNEDFTRIQSGNGETIAFQLLEGLVPDFSAENIARHVQTLIDAADSSKPNLLISSEHFSNAAPLRLAFLLELLGKKAKSVEIIVFARPMDRLCQSWYHQEVKRHSQYGGYDEAFFNAFSEFLLSQVFLIGSLPNKVHVFEYSRTAVLGGLLDFFGEDPALEESFSNQTVNRSLTEQEMDLLRSINAVFKSELLSTRISDRWIYAYPQAISTEARADRSRIFNVFQRVIFSNSARLSTVTCRELLVRLLPDDVLVPLHDEKSAVVRPLGECVTAYADQADLLRMAFEEIATLMSFWEPLSMYIQKLMPTRDNFDPVHYLLLNRDVLSAGVDPLKHFKEFGRSEGRFTAYKTNSALLD